MIDEQRAWRTLAEHGHTLRDPRRLDWPVTADQIAARLHASRSTPGLPRIVGVVGGASAGKSTVFNNLVGGIGASLVTAHGHATLGPILAVHESHRNLLDSLTRDAPLTPGLAPHYLRSDQETAGDPQVLSIIVHHEVERSDVWLVDTPDFTSAAALQEGDVTRNLFPWFDFLIVVIDHERWFDRQSLASLSALSERFGQGRYVLFNRTREGTLEPEERARLARQADRIGALGYSVLDYRFGRGVRWFPPGAFDELFKRIRSEQADRTPVLERRLAHAARRVLNQSADRNARWTWLRDAIEQDELASRPREWDVLAALTTGEERARLNFLSRTLGWSAQTRFWEAPIRVLRQSLSFLPRPGKRSSTGTWKGRTTDDNETRTTRTRRFFEQSSRRRGQALHRRLRFSPFWEDVRSWTGLEPSLADFVWTSDLDVRVEGLAASLDRALTAWSRKVDEECRGLAPRVRGALGLGGIGLAAVLVAVPGPLSALTIVSTKAALAATLTKLAVLSGTGALLGKPLTRFSRVVTERLWGTPEFESVRSAVRELLEFLDDDSRRRRADALEEAEVLLLKPDHELPEALTLAAGDERSTESGTDGRFIER